MSPSQQEIEQARSNANEIAHRLIDDAAFREQVRENPTATLTAAGLPEEAVTDFLREFNVPRDQDDVTGYLDDCGWTCMFTCDWTFHTQ